MRPDRGEDALTDATTSPAPPDAPTPPAMDMPAEKPPPGPATAVVATILAAAAVTVAAVTTSWHHTLSLPGNPGDDPDGVAELLTSFTERDAAAGLVASALLVAMAIAWGRWLNGAAQRIDERAPSRFGAHRRRLERYASSVVVLVTTAAAFGVVERIGACVLAGSAHPSAVGIDIVHAAAWLGWIHLVPGIGLLAMSVCSAAHRSQETAGAVTSKTNNTHDRGWRSGRHNRPSTFLPPANGTRRGISLSGGGIRSAAFSLGALQAVQESNLGKVDYIASVSGGGYMAGALESMRRSTPETPATDPVDAKDKKPKRRAALPVYEPRSPEERWFRHHSDYLVSSPSVVAGAVGSLLGGMLVNLILISAVAAVLFKPVGWAIGFAHPEMRADDPIVSITEQPHLRIDKVTFEPSVTLPNGKKAPGYVVDLSDGQVKLDRAANAYSSAEPACRPVRVTSAVVVETATGLTVARQPTVRLDAPPPKGSSCHRDSDARLRVVRQPVLDLTLPAGTPGAAPSEDTVDAVRRGVEVSAQPSVTWLPDPDLSRLQLDDWVWWATLGAALAAVGAWIVEPPIRRSRTRRGGADAHRHVVVQTLGGGLVATVGFLAAAPWVTQFMATTLAQLSRIGGAAPAKLGVFGLVLSTVAAAGRYFEVGASILKKLGRFRGRSKVVDAAVGALLSLVAFGLIEAILWHSIVAGPRGKIDRSFWEWLPWSFPDAVQWAVYVGVLLLGAIAAAPHAWSLFTFYRNRLRTAYLLERVPGGDGTVRPRDVTTRLDWSDSSAAPLPGLGDPEWIACTTVNIRGSGEAAPGRSAGSFTFSRSWVGGPEVGWMRTPKYKDAINDAKTDWDIASTIAISGAAFSPAMGKASRTWQGRLFAVLNLRLGVWVPNPMLVQGEGATLKRRRSIPRWPWYLREVLGWYDRTARFVYLTDGGHWENLGLVELFRRGCTDIWVISAAGDGSSSFDTVAEAIALAREEFGVEFHDLELEALRPQPPSSTPEDSDEAELRPRRLLRDGEPQPVAGQAFVPAAFSYPPNPGASPAQRIDGTIRIVEAALLGDLPWDVHAYAEANPDFPDISTGYQYMDHRDFEAYRMLGFEQTRRALNSGAPDHGPAQQTPS